MLAEVLLAFLLLVPFLCLGLEANNRTILIPSTISRKTRILVIGNQIGHNRNKCNRLSYDVVSFVKEDVMI
jgi:hypothetical protein